jgi:hypothetical protein
MHVHESPRQPQLHDRNLSCEWQAWEHRHPFFGVPTFFPFFSSTRSVPKRPAR